MPITIIHIFKLRSDPEFYHTASANKNPVIHKAILTNNIDIPSETIITGETKIPAKNNPNPIAIKDATYKLLYKLCAIGLFGNI